MAITEQERGLPDRGTPTIDPKRAEEIELKRLQSITPFTAARREGRQPSLEDIKSFWEQHQQLHEESHVWRYSKPDGTTYDISWKGIGTRSRAEAWASQMGHRLIGELPAATPARQAELPARRTEPPLSPPPLVQADVPQPRTEALARDAGPPLSPPPLVQADVNAQQRGTVRATDAKKRGISEKSRATERGTTQPPLSPPPLVPAPPPPLISLGTSQNKVLEEAKFVGAHPEEALAIGWFGDIQWDTNISTTAGRLAVRSGLDNTKPGPGEGTQVNALRHTTWQAVITARMGTAIAEEAGRAHEDNPDLVKGISDPTAWRYPTLEAADTACDLLNNRIGRSIGDSHRSMNPKQLAIEALVQFHTGGLWVASRNADGTFSIALAPLSAHEFQAAIHALGQLDAQGFNAREQAMHDDLRREREQQLQKNLDKR
jgi:hypothetical protein